jgi:RNA recognition motif-containing protein
MSYSLFVGNLSKYVKYDDIAKEFEAKGPCKIQLKVS